MTIMKQTKRIVKGLYGEDLRIFMNCRFFCEREMLFFRECSGAACLFFRECSGAACLHRGSYIPRACAMVRPRCRQAAPLHSRTSIYSKRGWLFVKAILKPEE